MESIRVGHCACLELLAFLQIKIYVCVCMCVCSVLSCGLVCCCHKCMWLDVKCVGVVWITSFRRSREDFSLWSSCLRKGLLSFVLPHLTKLNATWIIL